MDPMPPAVQLPNEPYGLAFDDYYGLLYVGHLAGDTGHPYTGGFSLFDVAPDGDGVLGPPEFIAPFPSPFSSSSSGLVGITNMTAIPQPDGTNMPHPPQIFAGSRYTPQVTSLGATANCGEIEAAASAFATSPLFRAGSPTTRGSPAQKRAASSS